VVHASHSGYRRHSVVGAFRGAVAAQGDEENVVRASAAAFFKIAAVTSWNRRRARWSVRCSSFQRRLRSTLRVSLKLRQYPTSTDASDARNVFTVRADFSIRAV